MSIRETLQKRKELGVALAAGMLVLAVSLIVWGNRSPIPSALRQAYYTTDDGQTYFADDIEKPYPFDHGGKPAYRAYVYRPAAGGKPFVAYLERYTDAAEARLTELRARPYDEVASEIQSLAVAGTEVKKPGDPKWVPAQSPAAATVTRPTAPDGSTDVTGVYP